jgi:uncharacterized membrane protein
MHHLIGKPELTAADHGTLERLRKKKPGRNPPPAGASRAALLADQVAATVGSWSFILVQTTVLVAWIAVNAVAWSRAWDPYPFILLNLVLSFQAAFTAPVIMMSQNRQAEVDRRNARHDYEVNAKAELEIELLHQKVDLLREREIATLVRLLAELEARSRPPSAGSDGA